jgi:hypothetical protein
MDHPDHVDRDAQECLIARLIEEGEDPEAWRCKTCGAIYDGGQCCTYCGDRDPLDEGSSVDDGEEVLSI